MADQNGIWNEYTDALWLDDSSFVVSEYILPGGFFGASKLTAFNLDGGQLWTQDAPDSLEIMAYRSLIQLSDTSFGVLGFFQACCDCTVPEPFLEIRNSGTGELIERVGEILTGEYFGSAYFEGAGNVAATSWGFAVLNVGWQNSELVYFSSQGDSLLTVDLEEGYNHLTAIQDHLVVASENEVSLYGVSGENVTSLELSAEPSLISSNNQRIAILADAELILLDENLVEVASVEMEDSPAFIEASYDQGFVFYNNEELNWILNDGSNLGSDFFLNTQGFSSHQLIANNDQIVLVGAKVSEPYTFSQIRHRYAAMRSQIREGGIQLWNSDLEVTNVDILELEITYIDEFISNYSANVEVTVRNNGTFPVNEFYLNHVFGQGICSPAIGNIPINQSLNSGQQATFLYPNISGIAAVDENDSAQVSVCVFVTQPSLGLDSDRDNDSSCATEMIFLSADDIELSRLVKLFPNPGTDQITLSTDLRLESYQIFDSFGRLIDQGVFNQVAQVNINSLTDGVYFLQAQTHRGVVRKKFVVSR